MNEGHLLHKDIPLNSASEIASLRTRFMENG